MRLYSGGLPCVKLIKSALPEGIVMIKLSFATLNVRGLNSSKKRRAIFRQLHNKKYSIIFYKRRTVLLIKKVSGATNGAAKFTFAMVINIAEESLFYLVIDSKC